MPEVSPEELKKYYALQDKAREAMLEYPDTCNGRGVVMCAGGARYFPCAWVCINMLRKHGCELPVEVWHLGPEEMDDRMSEILSEVGATTINAYEVREQHPVRRLYGWELNPYSIIHSRFEEVLFLDADNVPVVNPEFLFETQQYQATGAIFWPDFGRLAASREIWKICRVDYRDEPEFESGQIVVDKKRCWQELQMTMHLNEHSDFYYNHIHGDKDTFHMGWHMMGTGYSMPSRPIQALRSTMCQHDFDGRRIFQHRNMDKWKLDGSNGRIRGFEQEETCLKFLSDLREKWQGAVQMPEPTTKAGKELQAWVREQRLFDYDRIGYGNRTIELLPDGTIGRGKMRMEETWYIDESDDAELRVSGSRLTFTARKEGSVLKGKWVDFEKMPVVLTPLEAKKKARTSVPEEAVETDSGKYGESMINKRFIYIRVGHDKRVLEFRANNQIGGGAAGLEKVWGVFVEDKKVLLRIGPTLDDPICELEMKREGVWRGRWKKFEKMPVELVEIPN